MVLRPCKALKARAETADIPVLFLTSRNEGEALVEGFAVGGVDYISKPFHREEVLARVQIHLSQALEMRKLRRENEELRRG